MTIECATVPVVGVHKTSRGIQASSSTATELAWSCSGTHRRVDGEHHIRKADKVAQQLGIPLESRSMFPHSVNSCRLSQQCSGMSKPKLHDSTGSWDRHYHILSFSIVWRACCWNAWSSIVCVDNLVSYPQETGGPCQPAAWVVLHLSKGSCHATKIMRRSGLHLSTDFTWQEGSAPSTARLPFWWGNMILSSKVKG